jgi:hypothetical protein
MPTPIQSFLASYFGEWADVRRFQSQSHLEDGRYLQSAAGLDDLARHVLSLPPDDARLLRLDSLTAGFRATTRTFGGGVSRMTARFRFDDPREDFERFLARLVMAAEADAEEAFREGSAAR